MPRAGTTTKDSTPAPINRPKYTITNRSRGAVQIPQVEGLEGSIVLLTERDRAPDGTPMHIYEVTADVGDRLKDNRIFRDFVKKGYLDMSFGLVKM